MLPSARPASQRHGRRSLATQLRWLLCACGALYVMLLWRAGLWTLPSGRAVATSMRVTTPSTDPPLTTPEIAPTTSMAPTGSLDAPLAPPPAPTQAAPATLAVPTLPVAPASAATLLPSSAGVDVEWLRSLILTSPEPREPATRAATLAPRSLELHTARMQQLELKRSKLQASVAALRRRLDVVRELRLRHATVVAEADARLVRALPRQGVDTEREFVCLGWRATKGCDPRGPRDPANDKSCAKRVLAKSAGYCEIQDPRTRERFRVMETSCDSLRWDAQLTCADAPHFANFSAHADNVLRRARLDAQEKPIEPTQETTRGIVVVVYPKMLPSAYATLRTLRRLACTLPVELWYSPSELRDGERHPIVRAMADEYGPLTLRAINDTRAKGFTTKIHAIVHSAFDHVLFLDADNVPVRDPSFLFELPQYARTGALFWPDFWHPNHTIFALHERSLVWEYLDLPFVDMFEQESGQLVVDKTRSRAPLALLELYAHHEPNVLDTFKLVHGDKDLFRFAWLKANASFFMVESPPAIAGNVRGDMFCGQTMAQFDPQGELLFLHRNAKKLQGRRVKSHTMSPSALAAGVTKDPADQEEMEVDPEIWTHLLQLKPTSSRANYTVEIYKGSELFPSGQWCYGKPSPATPHFNAFRFADLPVVRTIESEIRAYAIEATDLVRDASRTETAMELPA